MGAHALPYLFASRGRRKSERRVGDAAAPGRRQPDPNTPHPQRVSRSKPMHNLRTPTYTSNMQQVLAYYAEGPRTLQAL